MYDDNQNLNIQVFNLNIEVLKNWTIGIEIQYFRYVN